MIEVSVDFMEQVFQLVPLIIIFCLIFEFLGSFFFAKK